MALLTCPPPRRQGIDSLALNLSAAVQAKDYGKSARALEEQLEQHFVANRFALRFCRVPRTLLTMWQVPLKELTNFFFLTSEEVGLLGELHCQRIVATTVGVLVDGHPG